MQPDVYLEMAEVQDSHWWFEARRKILAAVICEMAIPERAEILEVGCGTGGNLAMLADFGQLTAVECDDTARSIASDLGVCPVIAGKLPGSIPFANNGFDLVCLLDILEHIEDDKSALFSVKGLLKTSGRVLITVPAYPWLWSAHDEAHQHHRRYTAKVLRALALEAGYTVIRLGYFNSLLFPLISGHRLIQRMTGSSESSDASMPSPWVNNILNKSFSFERHIVRKRLFPFGVSLLVELALLP